MEEGKPGSRPHVPATATARGGGSKEGPAAGGFDAEGVGAGARASEEKAEDAHRAVGGKGEEGGRAGDRDRSRGRDESGDESAPLLRGPAFSPAAAVPAGAGSIQGYR